MFILLLYLRSEVYKKKKTVDYHISYQYTHQMVFSYEPYVIKK